MAAQMLYCLGAYLLEYPAAVLMEKFVGAERVPIIDAAEIPHIGTDIAGKLSHRLGTEDFVTVACRAGVCPFHDRCSGNIPKDGKTRKKDTKRIAGLDGV
jgi:hypothetical protein